MFRNLKVLIVAAMALAALGAFGASGARAAEEGKFHCSVAPCTLTLKPDGTGKTAHQVFVISNGVNSASMTCNEISGEATLSTKTTNEVTAQNIKLLGCTLAGSAATISMNGCDFLFTDSGEVHLKCPAGNKIHFTSGECTVEILPQTVSKTTFHDAAFPTKKEGTVETALKSILAHVTDGKCAGMGLPQGTYASSEYSTGNTIVYSTGNSVWFE